MSQYLIIISRHRICIRSIITDFLSVSIHLRIVDTTVPIRMPHHIRHINLYRSRLQSKHSSISFFTFLPDTIQFVVIKRVDCTTYRIRIIAIDYFIISSSGQFRNLFLIICKSQSRCPLKIFSFNVAGIQSKLKTFIFSFTQVYIGQILLFRTIGTVHYR